MREEDKDFDPTARPVTEPSRGHPLLALAIMLAGIFGVFAIGVGYDLFGKPITFTGPGFYLFYGSIWLGVFGLALAFMTVRSAFIVAVLVAAFYLLVFVAGKVSRGEF